jgi:hypothetical protein
LVVDPVWHAQTLEETFEGFADMSDEEREEWRQNAEKRSATHMEMLRREEQDDYDTWVAWCKENIVDTKDYGRKEVWYARAQFERRRSEDGQPSLPLPPTWHFEKYTTTSHRHLTSERAERAATRFAAIEFLGGCCFQCARDDIRLLHFDHIHDDGAEQRRLGVVGSKLYRDVLRFGLEQYQLLCVECHALKTIEARERARRERDGDS